ncbi:hypothetical protein CYY_004704 [Polysphondylium violaceum]|uniref:ABC transporter domain-containing protein n=1 Tax=Polysphondylium violaceum TaxID=133409 RepID=A0A8J4V4W9_9MYCE|nr:hypothetical protein CYY_004704 [Polysphondylium violaceum]
MPTKAINQTFDPYFETILPFYESHQGINTFIGQLNANGTNNQGFLGSIPQIPIIYNGTKGAKIVFTPSSQSFESNAAMTDTILGVKTQLVSQHRKSFKIKNLDQLPSFAVNFTQLDLPSLSLAYEISAEGQRMFQYKGYQVPGYIIYGMNLLLTGLLNSGLGLNIAVLSGAWELPYQSASPAIDIGSLLGGLFYPFALSFLLPLFVYSIVLEKQDKLRDLCLMMGLRMRNYWIVTYIFNFMLYLCAVIVVVGISAGFGFSVFTKGSAFAMVMFLFGWGNAQITFSFFLSTLFKRTRTASIFCYFLVIISVIVNLVLSAQLYLTTAPPVPYYFYPLFAFYRGFAIISTLCGIEECPTWSTYTWDFEPSKIILWLYIDTIFFLLVSLYLDQVLPREFGVPKHPLFFLQPIKNLFCSPSATDGEIIQQQDKKDETRLLIDSEEQQLLEEEIDEDVEFEKQKIINQQYNPNNTSIVINNLTKHYSGRPKPALDSLYLTIEKGETVALLGPNGAGKTTTISLLTGLYTPTSGNATVAGMSIKSNMDYIHRVVGVCNQFDILWEDLDCVETLLFYTRLKGIPKDQEMQVVEKTLKDVNLFEVRHRLAKELSGGMKRRLSIAISITGNSQIVFLDEPTTGLDIKTRRDLWVTINALKKDRCMILTSHSMEEVEVLSNRIGIMSQGKLKCLGDQQRLKTKFGDGYGLKLNIDPSYVEDLKTKSNPSNPLEFVQEFSADAKFVESYSNSFTYRLGKEIKLSDLFEFMLLNKDKHHVLEWGISQTSLEDVFLKIAANDNTVN